MSTENDILTLTELAGYLKVAERTIYVWAQNAEIPAYKMAGSWRFRRRDIDAWLETQRTGYIETGVDSPAGPPIGPTERNIQKERERAQIKAKYIETIEKDVQDRSRNEWAISRYAEFDPDILQDAISTLKRRKLIRTTKLSGETIIKRR